MADNDAQEYVRADVFALHEAHSKLLLECTRTTAAQVNVEKIGPRCLRAHLTVRAEQMSAGFRPLTWIAGVALRAIPLGVEIRFGVCPTIEPLVPADQSENNEAK